MSEIKAPFKVNNLTADKLNIAISADETENCSVNLMSPDVTIFQLPITGKRMIDVLESKNALTLIITPYDSTIDRKGSGVRYRKV